MKRFFCIACVCFLLAACQADRPRPDLSSAQAATQTLTDYFLANPQVEKIFPYLSQCKLAPAAPQTPQQNQAVAATYMCSVEPNDTQRYIAVVSADPNLMGEVDIYKNHAKDAVYIALLDYDKKANRLTGFKLLFNVHTKRVEKQTEVTVES